MPGAMESLGPYEIRGELGRGGMGVVYLGHDPRLNRDVAIKSLPVGVAADPDRLERFQREARVLAQLNHPHIAGIYGIEEQDGARYLILERVEGESLAQRLDRGPLDPDEAVEMAAQIADGVAAAHDAGIVHRDLKPANVMVTPAGKLKLLDFGLARPDEGASSSDLQTVTRTTPHPPTAAGAILGTAAYMSPEQARGRRVDRRTDVWSFGVVLYEMLTGINPFAGETVGDSIGAILHKECDFDRLPPGTPSGVARVLRRCLERDRDRRYRDLGDARLDLLAEPVAHAPHNEPAEAPRRVWMGPLGWAALALAAAALLWGWSGLSRRPAAAAASTDLLHIDLGTGELAAESSGYQLLISPVDRNLLAFVGMQPGADRNDPSRVCLYDLRIGEPRCLDGTEGAEYLRFSPDGRQLAFLWGDLDTSTELRKVAVDGGPVVSVVSMRAPLDFINDFFQWRGPDTLLVATATPFTLHEVSVSSGAVRALGVVDGLESIFVAISPVSYRDRYLLTPTIAPTGRGTHVIDLQTMKATLLIENGGAAFPIGDDRIVYAREDTLFIAPFDWGDLTFSGPATPVLDGLRSDVAFSISEEGHLAATVTEADRDRGRQIVTITRNGTIRPLIPARRSYTGNIRPSPDGTRLVATLLRSSSGELGAVVIDTLTGVMETVDRGNSMFVVGEDFAPDGRLVTLRATSAQSYHVMLEAENGPEPVLPRDRDSAQRGFTMTPDLRYVLLEDLPDGEAGSDSIVMVDLSLPLAERRPVPVVKTPNDEGGFDLSPDGEWLAYAIDVSGRSQIYVQPFDPARPQQRVRPVLVFEGEARRPFWSRDGRELFYENSDRDLMAVNVSVGPEGPEFGEPATLFTAEQMRIHFFFGYHIISEMPDGSFVYVQEPERGPSRQRYVLNWVGSLER